MLYSSIPKLFTNNRQVTSFRVHFPYRVIIATQGDSSPYRGCPFCKNITQPGWLVLPLLPTVGRAGSEHVLDGFLAVVAARKCGGYVLSSTFKCLLKIVLLTKTLRPSRVCRRIAIATPTTLMTLTFGGASLPESVSR